MLWQQHMMSGLTACGGGADNMAPAGAKARGSFYKENGKRRKKQLQQKNWLAEDWAEIDCLLRRFYI